MNYLQTKKNNYFLSSAFYTVVAELLLFIFYFLSVISGYSYSIIFLLLAIFVPILIILNNHINKDIKHFKNFSKGIKGEEDIATALQHLKDDYEIYQDVSLRDKLGDIDFVLVGNQSIIALEVKSQAGNIQYNDSKITINGVATEKDFLKQSKSGAIRLNHYIKDLTGQDIYVTPVLVFSSPGARVKFLLNKINGVYVVQKRYLDKVFGRIYNRSSQQFSKDKVVNALNQLA